MCSYLWWRQSFDPVEKNTEQLEEFIRERFLSNPKDELTKTTPLLSSGIIDSISALELVEFLEQQYEITFKPHEVDRENLNTISLISTFIDKKRSQ